MNTIVDGYNLIFAWGWLQSSGHSRALENARSRLVRELASRIPSADRGAVTIVFDAKKTPLKETDSDSIVSGFRVVFAQAYDEADALIEDLIGRHANPKSLTVVSSDNRIKTAATRRKAISVDSQDWLDVLERHSANRPDIAPPALSPKEQAARGLAETDWMKEFQLDDSESLENFEDDREGPSETYNPFPPGYGEDLESPD